MWFWGSHGGLAMEFWGGLRVDFRGCVFGIRGAFRI